MQEHQEKIEGNANVIKALETLANFIPLVMKEFEWYFIQVYLFQRGKMCQMLADKAVGWNKTQRNADYVIRHQFEHNKMNHFLDNLNQLVKKEDNTTNSILPKEPMTLAQTFQFLEVRLSAMTSASISLSTLYHLRDKLAKRNLVANSRTAAMRAVSQAFSPGMEKISITMALKTRELALRLTALKTLLQRQSENTRLFKGRYGYNFSAPLSLLERTLNAENLAFIIDKNELLLTGCHFNTNTVFGNPDMTDKLVTIDNCSGTVIFSKHEALQLIVKNSPKLHFILTNSETKNITIEDGVEELIIQSCLTNVLKIQGTIKKIHIEKGSVISSTAITSSIIGHLAIDESRTVVSLTASPLVHEITVNNKSLVQLSCYDSRIHKLRSDSFIYATFTRSVLAELDCEACDFSYLYFDSGSNLIDKGLTYSEGSGQLIKKNNRALTFTFSKTLTRPKSIDKVLDFTGNEIKSGLTDRMCQCLANCSDVFWDKQAHNLGELKPTIRHDIKNYKRLKNRIISRLVANLGVTLLRDQIDPCQTIWPALCLAHSVFNIASTSHQLPNKLLQLEFVRKMKAWQEESYQQHSATLANLATRTKFFALMNTDRIITKSHYDFRLKQQYLKDKDNLSFLFKVISYINIYFPTPLFSCKKKQELKNKLLELIIGLESQNLLPIQSKINLLENQIKDHQLLYGAILERGKMMHLIFRLISGSIDKKRRIDLLARNTRALLEKELVKNAQHPWASQLQNNLSVRLSQHSEANAVVLTLKEIDKVKPASTHSPLHQFKKNLSLSKLCGELKKMQSINEQSKATLRRCQLFCDHYQPVFSWFGAGRKKRICMQHLSRFIANDNPPPFQRLKSLQNKIDYLTQAVTETNTDSRNTTLLHSMPLWQGESRPNRGYRFMLEHIKKTLNGHNSSCSKNQEIGSNRDLDNIFLSKTTCKLLQDSQENFFNSLKTRSPLC